MDDNVIVFEDIMFAVLPIAHSHYVEYRIIKIESIEPSYVVNYVAKDGGSTPNIDDALVNIYGIVKWDGCSDWDFDYHDEGIMMHGCNREHLANIGEVLARCWDLTKSICPNRVSF